MKRGMIERFVNLLPEESIVQHIAIYPHWIAVLSVRHGLCCYIREMPGIDLPLLPDGAANEKEAGERFMGKTVREAARDALLQPDILSRSIGLALLNSALPEPCPLIEGEAQYLFSEKIRDAKTCCIGHFTQAREWREAGHDVTIIELNPRPGDVHWNDAAPFLAQSGIEPDRRLYTPVGLNIGWRKPQEIALAILAEIRMLVSGGSPSHRGIACRVGFSECFKQ